MPSIRRDIRGRTKPTGDRSQQQSLQQQSQQLSQHIGRRHDDADSFTPTGEEAVPLNSLEIAVEDALPRDIAGAELPLLAVPIRQSPAHACIREEEEDAEDGNITSELKCKNNNEVVGIDRSCRDDDLLFSISGDGVGTDEVQRELEGGGENEGESEFQMDRVDLGKHSSPNWPCRSG